MDTSYGFLVSKQVVHSQFMDLGNLVETIVQYLLIGGMTYLGCWDEFLIVSVLVYVMQIGRAHV